MWPFDLRLRSSGSFASFLPFRSHQLLLQLSCGRIARLVIMIAVVDDLEDPRQTEGLMTRLRNPLPLPTCAGKGLLRHTLAILLLTLLLPSLKDGLFLFVLQRMEGSMVLTAITFKRCSRLLACCQCPASSTTDENRSVTLMGCSMKRRQGHAGNTREDL